MKNRLWPLLFLVLCGIPRVGTAQTSTVRSNVELDHFRKTQTPIGRIGLRKGDVMNVVITQTNPKCFDYNGQPKPTEPAAKKRSNETGERVKFEVQHDGETTEYVFSAKLKVTPPEGCPTAGLSDYTWTVRVENYGWTVGVAGAFTGDNLTDPMFSLKEATRIVNGDSVQGFVVQENHDSRDKVKLGAAAMLHLYHSDPNFLGKNGIAWAPISFGIGVGDQTKTRYLVGTSVKFDNQLFLTVGAAVAPVSRLPAGLGVGDFTANSNALGTLGSRTRIGGFISLSYTFLNVDKELFGGPFKQSTPQ